METCNLSGFRWLTNNCYCDLGVFDGVFWFSSQQHSCTVLGRDSWGKAYDVFMVCAALPYVMIMILTLRRLVRLSKAPVLCTLQTLVHGLCFVAVVLRLVYQGLEASLVRNATVMSPPSHAERGSDVANWEWLTYGTFSAFYLIESVCFLCLILHYQMLINALKPGERCEHEAWRRRRDPICAALLLCVVEVGHQVSVAFAPPKALETLFSIWSSTASVVIAIIFFVIARRLHARIRELAPDSDPRFFEQLVASPPLLLLIAVAIFLLMGAQLSNSRFYAWPTLFGWTMTHFLDAARLFVVLGTIGSVRQVPTQPSENGSSDPSSTSAPSSFVSLEGGSYRTFSPLELDAFFSGQRTNVRQLHSVSQAPGPSALISPGSASNFSSPITDA